MRVGNNGDILPPEVTSVPHTVKNVIIQWRHLLRRDLSKTSQSISITNCVTTHALPYRAGLVKKSETLQ